jgi:hypothetical protein
MFQTMGGKDVVEDIARNILAPLNDSTTALFQFILRKRAEVKTDAVLECRRNLPHTATKIQNLAVDLEPVTFK